MLKPKAKREREESQGKAAAMEDVRKEATKRLNATVPASVYNQLKIRAAQEGRTINELVNNWIIEYLSE